MSLKHRQPYPVPHSMLKHFEEEIDRMLNLDIIEPSDSPYCSPAVLAKKMDNTSLMTLADARHGGSPRGLC